MTGQVGPRGLGVLVLVGLIGLALAVTGWLQRDTGLVGPSVGGLGGSVLSRTVRPSATPVRTAPVGTAPARTFGPPSASGGYAHYNLGDDALVVTTVQGQVIE